MMDWRGKTVDDAIAAWDAGESIWSIAMGGLGPGYEQAIQVLVVEMLRDGRHAPPPTDDSYSSWCHATVARLDESCGGFSGEQVCAARALAARMVLDGYAATISRVSKLDHLIQVSNFWPHAPATQEASA